MKYMSRAQMNEHRARERMRALRGEKLQPVGDPMATRAEECAACGYVHCACRGNRGYIRVLLTAHEYASMWDRLANVDFEAKAEAIGYSPLKASAFVGPNPKLRQWEPDVPFLDNVPPLRIVVPHGDPST